MILIKKDTEMLDGSYFEILKELSYYKIANCNTHHCMRFKIMYVK